MALGFRYQMTFIDEVVEQKEVHRAKSAPPVLNLSETSEMTSPAVLKDPPKRKIASAGLDTL